MSVPQQMQGRQNQAGPGPRGTLRRRERPLGFLRPSDVVALVLRRTERDVQLVKSHRRETRRERERTDAMSLTLPRTLSSTCALASSLLSVAYAWSYSWIWCSSASSRSSAALLCGRRGRSGESRGRPPRRDEECARVHGRLQRVAQLITKPLNALAIDVGDLGEQRVEVLGPEQARDGRRNMAPQRGLELDAAAVEHGGGRLDAAPTPGERSRGCRHARTTSARSRPSRSRRLRLRPRPRPRRCRPSRSGTPTRLHCPHCRRRRLTPLSPPCPETTPGPSLGQRPSSSALQADSLLLPPGHLSGHVPRP